MGTFYLFDKVFSKSSAADLLYVDKKYQTRKNEMYNSDTEIKNIVV